MINVRVTSYRPDGLRNLAQSMIDCGLAKTGALLSVSYDERTIDLYSYGDFPFMRMIPQPKFSGIPPMFALRRAIHKIPSEFPWLFFDDDDYFTPESTEYLIDCAIFINEFKRFTGRNSYIGTASFFGSNHHGDKIHISPVNALMSKGHGILFSPEIDFSDDSIFGGYDNCIGGFEDQLSTAVAMVHYDAVPFKRFLNPSKTIFRKESVREESDIHKFEIWDANAMAIIRQLSGDLKWKYPKGMGQPGTKTPKPWIKRAEKLKDEFKL